MYEAGLVIFHVSLVLYLLSLGHFARYVFQGKTWLASRALGLSLAGLAVHGVSIVVIAVGQGMAPWANSLQNISFWCWAVVSISAAVSYRFRLKALGLFVLPLVIAMLFMAMAGPKSSSGYGKHIGQALGAAVHVGLVFVAYAAFAVAAVLGFMYVLQSRYLKNHGTGEVGTRLPPLSVLDRLNYLAILAGELFLTAGLGLGMLWLFVLPEQPGSLDPKIIGSLIIWASYAALFVTRATSLLRGRKVAWLSMFGIVVIVLSFLFVPHVIPKELQPLEEHTANETVLFQEYA